MLDNNHYILLYFNPLLRFVDKQIFNFIALYTAVDSKSLLCFHLYLLKTHTGFEGGFELGYGIGIQVRKK